MNIATSIISYALFVFFSVFAWCDVPEGYSDHEITIRRYALLAIALACCALGKASINRDRLDKLENNARNS